jgi:hypothetical protein
MKGLDQTPTAGEATRVAYLDGYPVTMLPVIPSFCLPSTWFTFESFLDYTPYTGVSDGA